VNRRGRPSGWYEAAAALSAYGAYLLVRKRVCTDTGRERAVDNAAKIVAVEQRARVAVEPSVQRAALRWPRLVDVLNAGYAAGNVSMSVGWLMLLFRSRDADFRVERTAAMIAFAGALPVFAVLPTAPPRMLEGYVDDTMASRGWNLDHPHLVRFYNPIAAMPSHHVAFAMVTGLGLARRAGGRRARWFWRAYPAAVATTVVATGNHFVADVGAGAILGVLARRMAGVLSGGGRWR
jgi:hypothetical protein